MVEYKASCGFVSTTSYRFLCVCTCEKECVCVHVNCRWWFHIQLLVCCLVRFTKLPLVTFSLGSLSPGLMSTLSSSSEMQTSSLTSQFIVGPQAKIPGRRRGRPPVRKLEFQSDFVDTLSALKVPKKRGRKPGFKVSQSLILVI